MDQIKVDKKAITKRYFSSIFARKTPYIIFPCTDNTVVYTTINPDDITVYTKDFENVINVVKFSEPVYNVLLDIFPVLKNTVCVLVMQKFLPVFNKIDIEKIDLVIKDNLLYLGTKQDDGTCVLNDEPCGSLISDFTAGFYLEFLNSINQNLDVAHTEEIKLDNITKEPVRYFDMLDDDTSSLKSVRWFRLPYVDGLNGVSISEFVKKTVSEYSLQVKCWHEGKAIHAVIIYKDPSVTVTCIQPDAMWFPLPPSEEMKSKTPFSSIGKEVVIGTDA